MAKRHVKGPARSQPRRVEAAPSPRLWIWIIILGFLLRIALAAVSIGTNDAAAWLRFGDEINSGGLLHAYSVDRDFNHPPIPGYWAAICAKLAGDSDSPLHDSVFTILFKIAPIAGDALATYVLFLLWRKARGRDFGLFVAAMFAISLDAIAVSGFHCNTDPLLIALVLLSLYLFGDRPLLSGLALAAAVNVKIIPVLLIPPLMLQTRSIRQLSLFTAGLAVGVLPFLPPLLAVPKQFIGNALQYNSMLDRWGINYFLLFGDRVWNPNGAAEKLSAAYYARARYIILALIGLWSILARRGPRRDPVEVAFVTFAIFLVLAPGFGVQYTVLAGLLLFGFRPLWGIAYGILAGLFISAAYFANLQNTFPLYAHWSPLFPEPVALLGLGTWVLLIVVTIGCLSRPAGVVLKDKERQAFR